MKSCVFCEIAEGRRASATVWQDDRLMCFLDHRPLFPGHVLVCPRAHRDTLLDLPAAELAPLLATVQRVCAAVRDACGAQGSFVAVNNGVSQSVPHLHVHVVPRSKGDGLRGFFWPRHPYRDDGHREQVRARIAERLAG